MHYRWPVEAHPIGSTAAATVAWRHRGRLRVSVVVKASFSFVASGLMPLVAPDDIYATEIHHEGNPARSVWAASDLAPYRTQADVVLTGHALVPTERATVRLAVYRERALIDKSLDVVPSGAFEGQGRVPLLYEHAPGGPAWDDNPVGTLLPSIVDASDPQRPVGFGPIAAAWPVRARRRGLLDLQALAAPIANLPDELDWRYFCSAPADQVTAYLQGDEWIVLENLVAAHPLVRMRLPSAHAEARVFGLGPEPGPAVTLVADHLHIDVDRARCSVTWRGSFDVGSEEAMRRAAVRVGVAVAGQPIAWPTLPPPQRAPIVVPSAPSLTASPPSTRLTLPTLPTIERAASQSLFEMTMVIEDEPPNQPVLPFVHAVVPPAHAPVPPPSRLTIPSNPFESTMTISDDEASQVLAGKRALPFAPAPMALRAATAGPLPEASYMLEEASITDDEPEETTVPMAQALRRAKPGARARPSQGIPGAPWSGVPAAPVQRPGPELEESTTTLQRDKLVAQRAPELLPKEPAPPRAPAIPAAPPAKEKDEAKASWSWGSVDDAPKVEMKPPPPPPRAPLPPAVQSALYSRFTVKKK